MFWISADLSFFLFFFSSKVLLPDRSSVDGGSVEINSRGFSACQRLVAWHHEPPQPHYPAALLYSPPTPTLTATDTQPPPPSAASHPGWRSHRLRGASEGRAGKKQFNNSVISPPPPPPLILHLSIIKNEHLTVLTGDVHQHMHARRKQQKQKRKGSTEGAVCVCPGLGPRSRTAFSSNIQRSHPRAYGQGDSLPLWPSSSSCSTFVSVCSRCLHFWIPILPLCPPSSVSSPLPPELFNSSLTLNHDSRRIIFIFNNRKITSTVFSSTHPKFNLHYRDEEKYLNKCPWTASCLYSFSDNDSLLLLNYSYY